MKVEDQVRQILPTAYWSECASPQGMKHAIYDGDERITDWVHSEEQAWEDALRIISKKEKP
jgi:hypothetical protein